MYLPFKPSFLIFLLFLPYIKPDLEIHIIPHSHMDPGWGLTVDEYYNQRVKAIYNTVYAALQSDPSYTFVICEMIFFKRWYFEQPESTRSAITSFINEHRIEFVGGGWVMHDEANSYYQDMLDQMRLGLHFLKTEFNIQPQTAWQIDPFGHSSTNAYIMSHLGFKQIVIDRINHQEHGDRMQRGEMAFIYKPYNDIERDILFHVTPFHYGAPICNWCLGREEFDINNKDVQRKMQKEAETLVNEVMKSRKGYKTPNVMMHLLGGDFQYMRGIQFKRLKTVIEYVNEKEVFNGEKVKLMFSTPEKYFNAVEQERTRMNVEYTVQSEIDFFTYADKEYSYWSGYFTSRPYLKGVIREGANMLLSGSTILSDMLLKGITPNDKLIKSVEQLSGTIANMQHHDAVTGTSNERVSNSFIKETQNNTEQLVNLLTYMLSNFTNTNENITVCMSNPTVNVGCFDTLINETKVYDVKEFHLTLINPNVNGKLLINMEFKYLSDNDIQIEEISSSNLRKVLPSDYYCINKYTTQNEAFGYENKCFLSFFYTFKPSVMLRQFVIKITKKHIQRLQPLPTSTTRLVHNKGNIINLIYNPQTEQFTIKLNTGKTGIQQYTFTLYHAHYVGFVQGTQSNIRPSHTNNDGLYVFAPMDLYPTKYTLNPSNSFIFIGHISCSVILRFNEGTTMLATFYYNPTFLKLDHIIDPIITMKGFNYVFGLQSDIHNNISVKLNDTAHNTTHPEFWTDSNGLRMIRRITNYIHRYNHIPEEQVAINFYPVPLAISLRERKEKYYYEDKYHKLSLQDRMITVFTDKPQSGGALNEGEIMLLIDRNSKKDDGKGISSPNFEKHSSKSYFKVGHVVVFGRSIYKGENDMNGMLTRKFLRNYYHNVPLVVNGIEKKALKEKSSVNELFKVSDRITKKIQVVKENVIVVQFYCDYDWYFMGDVEKECTVEMEVEKVKERKMRVVVDGNGISKIREVLNGEEKGESGDKIYTLMNNEFLFLYLMWE